MIEVAISYGFGSDNRYNDTGALPKRIQLALYKYELYQQQKTEIFKTVKENHTHVPIAHMPLDFLRQPPHLMIDMIKEIHNELGTFKFIVHPNKGIRHFLTYFVETFNQDVQLCIENFPWKKKKELRSPLYMIEYLFYLNQIYDFSNIYLCLDTSHTDVIWFEYQLMGFILPYVSVIHLSNREGRKQHLPFNTGKGDLNLVGFVKDLPRRYNWEGDIVLEYLPDYRHKLTQNARYIQRLLYGDSRRNT